MKDPSQDLKQIESAEVRELQKYNDYCSFVHYNAMTLI